MIASGRQTTPEQLEGNVRRGLPKSLEAAFAAGKQDAHAQDEIAAEIAALARSPAAVRVLAYLAGVRAGRSSGVTLHTQQGPFALTQGGIVALSSIYYCPINTSKLTTRTVEELRGELDRITTTDPAQLALVDGFFQSPAALVESFANYYFRQPRGA